MAMLINVAMLIIMALVETDAKPLPNSSNRQ